MGKLKRVVALNYPASRLPDDLRGDIDPTHRVDITVEEEGPEGSEYETTVRDFADLPSFAEPSNPPDPATSRLWGERDE